MTKQDKIFIRNELENHLKNLNVHINDILNSKCDDIYDDYEYYKYYQNLICTRDRLENILRRWK